jgi:hypothetical protein
MALTVTVTFVVESKSTIKLTLGGVPDNWHSFWSRKLIGHSQAIHVESRTLTFDAELHQDRVRLIFGLIYGTYYTLIIPTPLILSCPHKQHIWAWQFPDSL